LFDVRDVCERIKVGSGKTMEATKIGSLRCNTFQVLLQKVVAETWVNLLNLTRLSKMV
jgi:hypothetical protein